VWLGVWVVCGCDGVGVGAYLCGGVGAPGRPSVGCQGLSNERAVGSHGAVCLTWGVWWLVWCCGLQPEVQEEGSLVLSSQDRSGLGVGCRRVSADGRAVCILNDYLSAGVWLGAAGSSVGRQQHQEKRG
jgi:hypothetical protein